MNLAQQVGYSVVGIDMLGRVKDGVGFFSSDRPPAQLLPAVLISAGEVNILLWREGTGDRAVHVFSERAYDEETGQVTLAC